MFWFKHAVILDVVSVAIGFVLRAVAGAVVIGVQFSHWLMVCTFFLALFLIVCKRRHELVLLGEESSRHRRSLVGYSPAMLDQMVAVVTSSAVITYALYAVSADTVAKFGGDQLIYTLPFVVFGIFRYLYLVYRKEEGGSPEGLLLNDKPLLLNILLYGVTAALLVYWK
jgi:4-hydroxybenzoate polyprenyltransferase